MKRQQNYIAVRSVGILLLLLHTLNTFSRTKITTTTVAAAIPNNRWSKSSLEELSNQWNNDFDEDDISTDEHLYRESERRQKEAMDKLQNVMDGGRIPENQEFEELAEEVKYAGKPAMIFAKLNVDEDNVSTQEIIEKEEKHNTIREYSWDELSEICNEWQVSE